MINSTKNEKPMDRRVRRTRRALQEALIHLILEEGYDSVTIEEITDRADLGRTTFYLHFRDKEALLMEAIDTICEDFIKEHSSLLEAIDGTENSLKKIRNNLDDRILYHIFAYARQHADLYKVMLRGEGGAKASQRFTNIIREETRKRLKQIKGLETKVPMEIFAVFFAGTLIEMVTWWLEQDQPYTIEVMVGYFQQLFLYGSMDTLKLVK